MFEPFNKITARTFHEESSKTIRSVALKAKGLASVYISFTFV